MQKTQIIVCYHKKFKIFKNDILLPLHVGKSCSDKRIVGTLCDDSGDNISYKNKSFCELTGIYWLWKNSDADNYGLFHYRRFLDLSNKYNSEEYPSKLNMKDWSQPTLDSLMDKYDIILPEVMNMDVSVYDYYKKCHNIKDLDIVIDIIKKDYPKYSDAVDVALNKHEASYFNVFIMKKDLFNEYCSWLFDILFKAEKQIDTSSYDVYQNRIFGFIAERLFNIFVEYKKQTDSKIKIKYVNVINILEPTYKINLGFMKFIKSPNKLQISLFGIKITKNKKN